jgi:hypothetical protein
LESVYTRDRKVEHVEQMMHAEAAQVPDHGARAAVDLRDLTQRAEREDDIAVPVEVECIAVGPVHIRERAVRRIEIANIAPAGTRWH